MQSGKLRHRVLVQHDTATTAGIDGHITPTWSTLGRRWANVEPLAGREFWNAQQVQAGITHSVVMRWWERVTPRMQIIHGGRTLRIESVLNTGERGREMKLLCTEMV